MLHWQTVAPWTALTLVCACAQSNDPKPGPDQETRCVDPTTLRICHPSHGCSELLCRSDQLCDGSGCVAWQEANLWADFTVEVDDQVAGRVTVKVDDGGFPRHWREHLRFDFGDGTLGLGEWLWHTYSSPGIYPITLEVQLVGNVVLRASQLAVVQASAGAQDSEMLFTVNEIPAHLNGSSPFRSNNNTPNDPTDDFDEEFFLLLPTSGFSVDFTFMDHPDNPLQFDTLTLTMSEPLANGTSAGTNLAALLIPTNQAPFERVRTWRWQVDSTQALPSGIIAMHAAVQRQDGSFIEESLTVETVLLTSDIDPFSRPSQWLFRFDMDYFTATAAPGSGTTLGLTFTPEPNGKADFTEELAIIGAQGDESAPGASTVVSGHRVGANAIFLGWIYHWIVHEVHAAYDSERNAIPIEIIVHGEPGAPDPSDYSADGNFAMMRLGGWMNNNLGRSLLSDHNQKRVDNTSSTLGVATGIMLNALSGVPGFSELIDPIKPHAGTPVGQHPADAVVLSPDYDPFANNPLEWQERYDDLSFIARLIALPIASVTAHEMGHAMGLMPLNAPPHGFFGGRPDASVVGPATDGHHTHFTPVNLMQAGGNLLGTITLALNYIEKPINMGLVELATALLYETRLSPYSRAYLRRELTYDPHR